MDGLWHHHDTRGIEKGIEAAMKRKFTPLGVFKSRDEIADMRALRVGAQIAINNLSNTPAVQIPTGLTAATVAATPRDTSKVGSGPLDFPTQEKANIARLLLNSEILAANALNVMFVISKVALPFPTDKPAPEIWTIDGNPPTFEQPENWPVPFNPGGGGAGVEGFAQVATIGWYWAAVAGLAIVGGVTCWWVSSNNAASVAIEQNRIMWDAINKTQQFRIAQNTGALMAIASDPGPLTDSKKAVVNVLGDEQKAIGESQNKAIIAATPPVKPDPANTIASGISDALTAVVWIGGLTVAGVVAYKVVNSHSEPSK